MHILRIYTCNPVSYTHLDVYKRQCISHAFMIPDIATSIGEFDVSDEDYLFMKEFVANAVYDDYDLSLIHI